MAKPKKQGKKNTITKKATKGEKLKSGGKQKNSGGYTRQNTKYKRQPLPIQRHLDFGKEHENTNETSSATGIPNNVEIRNAKSNDENYVQPDSQDNEEKDEEEDEQKLQKRRNKKEKERMAVEK
jgi:hypothetical protein